MLRLRPAPAALILTALAGAAPSLQAIAAPPAGTETTTRFCGSVVQTTPDLANHGIGLGDPYVGRIELTQRDPDFDYTQTHSTEWDCTAPNAPCGTWSIDFGDFVPPGQTEPTEIFGPVADIDQTLFTYRLGADLDGFVTGAVGAANLQIVCTTCTPNNDRYSIEPSFVDLSESLAGDATMILQVPGIPSSPGGSQDVVLSVDGLTDSCRRILPATSPWGLVGLVALLVATALAVARRSVVPQR